MIQAVLPLGMLEILTLQQYLQALPAQRYRVIEEVGANPRKVALGDLFPKAIANVKMADLLERCAE
jgi:hypothetical protein